MKNERPLISATDLKLWETFTENVKKIENDRIAKQALKRPSTFKHAERAPPPFPEASANHAVLPLSAKETRHIAIDGTIDLHGAFEKEAERLTKAFLLRAYNHGLKWVLIVTGKGKARAPGVLRTALPAWLEESAAMVVGYALARQDEGGDGAFYVKIRNKAKKRGNPRASKTLRVSL